MRDVVRVVTVSPGMVTPAQLRALVEAGIIVMLGHTDATYDEAVASFAQGASGVTHLFNAMSQMQRGAPGTAGAALATREVWATIIADGHHVHPGAILAAKRAKGERLLLVSDAMPPAGHGDGTFRLGPHEIVCRSGRCTRPDGGLAGSAITLSDAVAACVRESGVDLDDAWRMASTLPAAFLGRSDCGRVATGLPADLVALDADLRVSAVVRQGVVRRRPSS